jgi:hypothetical protein
MMTSRLPFDLLLSFPDVCTLADFHIMFMLRFRTALFYRDMNLYFAVWVFSYGQTATVATNIVLFVSSGLRDRNKRNIPEVK